MSLACVLARVRRRWGRVGVLAALCAMLALVPLAHASPPDPVWLAGIYDAGDSDDVIVAATSLESRDAERLDVFSPVAMEAGVFLETDSRPRDVCLHSSHARSPPNASS